MSIRIDAMYKAARDAATKVTCRRCAGSGDWAPGRTCFACNGSGKQRVDTKESVRLHKLAHVTEVREMLVEAEVRVVLQTSKPRWQQNAKADAQKLAAQLETLQAELAAMEAA